ncbi:hypothetical protein ACOMHN_022429 [Nucella lapillus]
MFVLLRPCSEDDSFEQVDIVPVGMSPPNVDLNSYVPVSQRTSPLTREQFESMLDKDGRLVSEHQLRQAVFLGGVQPCIRKEVWRFVFGLYPCTSTAREREALLLDYIMKYNELKSRWKTLLVLASAPGRSPLEQGLVARYQFPQDSAGLHSGFTGQPEPVMERAMDDLNSQAARVQAGSVDFAALGHGELAGQYSAPGMQQRLDCLQLQARVYVNRKRININQLRSYLRIIDKDVPRTDRDVDYYKGHANPHLTQLREILATFTCYNEELGYAQGMNDILSRFLYVLGSEGMNDILSRFLYVLGSEVETFWCFKRYMDTVQLDFMEEGMLRKIEQQ